MRDVLNQNWYFQFHILAWTARRPGEIQAGTRRDASPGQVLKGVGDHPLPSAAHAEALSPWSTRAVPTVD